MFRSFPIPSMVAWCIACQPKVGKYTTPIEGMGSLMFHFVVCVLRFMISPDFLGEFGSQSCFMVRKGLVSFLLCPVLHANFVGVQMMLGRLG